MNVPAVAPDLTAALPAYVARQRWFGAKRSSVAPFIVRSDERDGLHRVVIDAGGEEYQLLLGHGSADAVGVPTDALVDPGDDPVWFDALADPALCFQILARTVPGATARQVRPITGEQSNSSLVFDNRVIVKVFRRPLAPNPEIDVMEALSRHGYAQIPEVIGVWRWGGDDVAIAQRFLDGARDGWGLALTSLRDGTDFAPDAAHLGATTASLHVALAAAFGVTDGDPGVWADACLTRMEALDHPDVDRRAVAVALASLRDLREAGPAIRIHGDLHLGQVLYADDQWFVLDFEGEPTRPLPERSQPTSPLRDVAGMLRSFGYAAAVGGDAEGTWEQRTRSAYLDAYQRGMAGTSLLPPDATTVLRAFELDKAVYEVHYEQGHRPEWVEVPIAAIRRMLAQS